MSKTCSICGEPMPPGEEMFKFHGYSGPCPKPSMKKPDTALDRIMNDPKLQRARSKLSFHEIRLIIDHVRASSLQQDAQP